MDQRTSALETLLAAHNWNAADRETQRLLVDEVDVGGYAGVDADEAAALPCDLLRAIDVAWTEASDGRFGLRAQNRILAQTISEGYPGNEVWRQFGRTVGWVGGREWIEADEVDYTDEAPEGHLPWVPGFGTVVNTGRIYDGFRIFYNRYNDCKG
ncbi:MAG: GUN4 domain-containing protein [Acidimicrobiia bacterium]|nr:GUN4 domain-containing protein [Acidimicrobiia bacterium]